MIIIFNLAGIGNHHWVHSLFYGSVYIAQRKDFMLGRDFQRNWTNIYCEELTRPQRNDGIVPTWVLKPENKDSVSSSLSPDLKVEIFPASVPTGRQWSREKKVLSS